MTTIFEKIIARDIPAHVIYEDEQVMAFFDNQPVHPGHTLVVPKYPYTNLFDMPSDTFAHMARVAHQVALVVRTHTEADGLNVYMNNDTAAGQEVFHAHMHVVPRYHHDDRYQAPKRANTVDPSVLEDLARTLQNALDEQKT
jgi:histidine triad (HIT) family protein